MEPIRPYSTLRKMRDNAAVSISCTRCGHAADLPFEMLAARIGWDTEIDAPADMLVHLRCGKCALKHANPDSGDKIQMTLVPRSTLGAGGYPEW